MWYVRVSGFVVRRCAVSRGYINVCNCDMFSDNLKFCVVRICFRGELGFLNCDDICICVANKQFELL